MSLARVKVWNPGDALTAADLNAEFNNVLNNPVSLISPSTGPINFNLQAHTNLVPAAITASSALPGSVLVATTAATPGSVWSGSAMQGSRVRGLFGTISSQSGTFAADQFIMQTTGGFQSWTVTATSSFGASIGTAGPAAGGRDVAGAFSSTEIHWYAISTGPGSTAPAATISTQKPPTGPVLPSGYTGWSYLGCSPYTSASTTVNADHVFSGRTAQYMIAQTALSAGASTAIATVSYHTLVPSNGTAVVFFANTLVNTSGGNTATLNIYSTTGQIYNQLSLPTPTAGANFTQNLHLNALNISRQISYNWATTWNTQQFNLNVAQYGMPNGDA